MPANAALRDELARRASELGFAQLGISRLAQPWAASKRLHTYLEAGYHGDMTWMSARAEQRAHPNKLWPQARSAIVLGMNYGPDHDPMQNLAHRNKGNISVYARGRDYHDLVKKRLKNLARWLHQETKEDVKVFVDTAPLMEKPLAQLSGLGWQGKHTNLVSRQTGSWMFLGVILTMSELVADKKGEDHCGNCNACLDVCPTKAFVAPYQLDARACISYLTIEHKSHIPVQYRKAMGNRIYGCDDCLAVCPWNKYAQAGKEAALLPGPERSLPELAMLAGMDDAAFRAFFAGSPVKRTGRDRFIRNVLIAIGNSDEPELAIHATALLQDPSPLVRSMAIWALAQLLPLEEFEQLAKRYQPQEVDNEVALEWAAR